MGTINIADILKKRDPVKYAAIIKRAANNGYHDHKFDKIPGHPEYGDTFCPKITLVEHLSKFPELEDIRQDVMSGKYDEPADEQDIEEMRDWLIQDGAPDAFFESFGIKLPTAAERKLNRAINN